MGKRSSLPTTKDGNKFSSNFGDHVSFGTVATLRSVERDTAVPRTEVVVHGLVVVTAVTAGDHGRVLPGREVGDCETVLQGPPVLSFSV